MQSKFEREIDGHILPMLDTILGTLDDSEDGDSTIRDYLTRAYKGLEDALIAHYATRDKILKAYAQEIQAMKARESKGT